MEHIHRLTGFSRFRLSPSFKGGCRKTKTATPVCRRFCKTKPPSRTQKPPLNGYAAFTIRAKFFWKRRKHGLIKQRGGRSRSQTLSFRPFLTELCPVRPQHQPLFQIVQQIGCQKAFPRKTIFYAFPLKCCKRNSLL